VKKLQRLIFGTKLLKNKINNIPDPTTTNKKNPSKTGPTGNFSSFFYERLNYFYRKRSWNFSSFFDIIKECFISLFDKFIALNL